MAVLFQNGNVIDGTGAPARAVEVLVEGNRITAVGAEAARRAAGLADLQRLDLAGATLMPGLIDAHCHVTFDAPRSNDELFFHRRAALSAIIAAADMRKLLCAGVTGFFDADSIFEIGTDLRDAIEAGVVEGPRMATGGHALLTSVGGTAGRLFPDEGIRGYAVIVRSRDEIVAEVRRQIKHGVDWIKVHVTGSLSHRRSEGEMVTFTKEELRLICDLAHDFGVQVMGHCRGAHSIKVAAECGFDQISHATLMDDAALEAVVKHNVFLVPALTFQANLMEFGDAINASTALQDIFRKEIEDSSAMLAKAFRAGVPVLCGSESGFSVTPYGDWHYRELEVFCKYLGLTPLEAIRCATKDGALALRMKDQVGSIEAGRLADLLLIDGDPSRDVTVLGRRDKLRMVMKGGKSIDLNRTEPTRTPMSEWRVHEFGSILSKDVVSRARGGKPIGGH